MSILVLEFEVLGERIDVENTTAKGTVCTFAAPVVDRDCVVYVDEGTP